MQRIAKKEIMKRKSHAPVPPIEDEGEKRPNSTGNIMKNKRKSMVRKGASFDALEQRPTESTTQNRPSHIIDFQFMVNNIAVYDLEDTGTRFDEQDPMVTIAVGTAKAETDRQEDAGTNANFPESFIFDLTEEDANGVVSSNFYLS